MPLTPYLFFDGRCEEALEFYKKTLGAEVEMMMRFRENPDASAAMAMAPGTENKIMHACVRLNGMSLMASDGYAKGNPNFEGFSLSIDAADEADARQKFDALSDGGEVVMPLTKTFYARSFGMVKDRFGVGWMVILRT